MLLSVVVPVYNRLRTLPRCLDSILSQLPEDAELILVDDGSTDGSRDLIDRLQREHENVTALFREHGGVAQARSAGYFAARGDFLTYVDSDDYLPAGSVAKLEALARTDRYDILLFDALECFPDGTRRVYHTFRDGQSKIPGGPVSAGEYMLSATNTWNRWVRRSLIRELFGENEPFPAGLVYEDLATVPLFGLKTDRIYFLAEPCYCYVQEGGSIMRGAAYRPVFDDIFPVTERVEQGLRKLYPAEAEYLWWEHLLVTAGKRYLACGRTDLAAKTADRMREHFPKWRENRYIRREPKKKRVLAGLLYGKHYRLLKALGRAA